MRYFIAMAFEYLDKLNPEQKEAVVHKGSPLLILAGAGSGKTRVITTKIAYLIQHENIRSWQILAVTFTKKAADEMRERAVSLEPSACESQIKTFHSFGAWFLRKYGLIAGIDNNFTVYDDSDSASLLQKALPHLTKKKAQQLAKKIALCKDYCLTPEDDISSFDEDGDLEEAYKAYQKRLRETGNVDFGDLIMLPVILLEGSPELRQQMQHHFKVIMVDEYQDSNVAQFRLLQALSGVQEGSSTYVCVVGDDDQSIYRFRGAEIQNILQFPNIFPDTQLIRLERNYRSTARILEVADAVVQNNTGRIGKTLIAEGEEGTRPCALIVRDQNAEAELCSKLIKNAVSSEKCPAKFSDFAILYRTNAQSLEFEHEFLHKEIPYKVVGSLKFYEREEIKDILSYLSLLANGRDEIAFHRIANKPVRGLGEKSLEKLIEGAKRAGVNDLILAAEFAGEGKALKAPSENSQKPISQTEKSASDNSISLTENMAEKTDGQSPASLADKSDNFILQAENMAESSESTTSPALYISLTKKAQEGAKELASLMKSLKEELEENSIKAEENSDDENFVSPPLSYFIEKIIKDSGLEEYHKAQDEIDGTSRVENMQELANYGATYPCTKLGLLDFLDSINLDRTLSENSETDENADAVTLITLHNTKGLEFNRVIITGMESGIFPREDKTGSDLEEERRLFYVGITRARKELTLICTRSRKLYGHIQTMAPSIFLKEAEEALDIQNLCPSIGFGSGYGYNSYGYNSYGSGSSGYGNYSASGRNSGFGGNNLGENDLGEKSVFEGSSAFGQNPAFSGGNFSAGTFSDPLREKYKKGTKIFHDDWATEL